MFNVQPFQLKNRASGCGDDLFLEVTLATIHRQNKGQDPRLPRLTHRVDDIVMSFRLRPRAIEPRSGMAASSEGRVWLCRREMHTLRIQGTKPMKLEPGDQGSSTNRHPRVEMVRNDLQEINGRV